MANCCGRYRNTQPIGLGAGFQGLAPPDADRLWISFVVDSGLALIFPDWWIPVVPLGPFAMTSAEETVQFMIRSYNHHEHGPLVHCGWAAIAVTGVPRVGVFEGWDYKETKLFTPDSLRPDGSRFNPDMDDWNRLLDTLSKGKR